MYVEPTPAEFVARWNREQPIGTPVVFQGQQNAHKTETSGRARVGDTGRAVVPLKNGTETHYPFSQIEADPSRKPPTIFRYEAVFEQPRLHLNRLGVRVPGRIVVDVRATSSTAKKWAAYFAENNKQITYNTGSPMESPNPGQLMAAVAELFEIQHEPWLCFADLIRSARA